MPDRPQFVILRHEPPPEGGGAALHWDLMLEAGSCLKTWALDQEPQPEVSMPARQLADHRREYLRYEGPLSRGRGTVSCWDRGSFCWRLQSEDQIEIGLFGHRLRGIGILQRDAQTAHRWTFRCASP